MHAKLKATEVKTLVEALVQFERWTHGEKVSPIFIGPSKVGWIYDVKGIVDSNGFYTMTRYAVTFKRGWYRNFGHDFPNCPDRGYGQIATWDMLMELSKKSVVWLAAVMPEGVCYRVNVEEFIQYALKYKTDVDATPGKAHLVGEVACPIRMWERVYPQ